jgi:hypothetical protein
MGLWDGVLDMNGIDKLAKEPPSHPELPAGGAMLADRFPLCGMNVAFAAEITPCLHFLPDFSIDGWKVSRHDDIWGGYVAQSLLRLNGDLMSFGEPAIEHMHQNPLEKVVVLEHYQHLLARTFFDLVDEVINSLARQPYPQLFHSFADEFERTASKYKGPGHYGRAFGELGASMQRWAACFA